MLARLSVSALKKTFSVAWCLERILSLSHVIQRAFVQSQVSKCISCHNKKPVAKRNSHQTRSDVESDSSDEFFFVSKRSQNQEDKNHSNNNQEATANKTPAYKRTGREPASNSTDVEITKVSPANKKPVSAAAAFSLNGESYVNEMRDPPIRKRNL